MLSNLKFKKDHELTYTREGQNWVSTTVPPITWIYAINIEENEVDCTDFDKPHIHL